MCLPQSKQSNAQHHESLIQNSMYGIGEIKSINAYRVALHEREQSAKAEAQAKEGKRSRVAASQARARASAK